jgi:hypothetical protein
MGGMLEDLVAKGFGDVMFADQDFVICLEGLGISSCAVLFGGGDDFV